MHRKGLKCAMSRIQIGEAVLELKRGRILRDYSNESLREAYKNSVFSIIFDWNRWQHSLVRMGTPPGPKGPRTCRRAEPGESHTESAVSEGPGAGCLEQTGASAVHRGLQSVPQVSNSTLCL